MAPCPVGLEEATDDDPQALSYCRRECPLTEVVPDRDAEGQIIGEHFEGCDGRARTAAATSSRDNVIKAKMLNRGTDVWAVEHECKRPTSVGMIYDAEKVQAAVMPLDELERPAGPVRRAVGIDWGRFAVAVLAERAVDHVAVREGRIFDSQDHRRPRRSTWWSCAAASATSSSTAMPRTPTATSTAATPASRSCPCRSTRSRTTGIENLARYFNHGKIKIADDGHLKTVIRQLLRYRRNEAGRIVKEDDHGPDALMCAMLHFPFIDEFDTALGQLLSGTDRERLKVTNALLDACVHDYPQEMPEGGTCSMGVSMGTSGFYVVVSWVPSTTTAGSWSPARRCSSAGSRTGATWTR